MFGRPDFITPCGTLYDYSIQQKFQQDECDTLVSDANLISTCGCTRNGVVNPITPSPAGGVTSAPVVGPVITPAPAVITHSLCVEFWINQNNSLWLNCSYTM
jgi:hypothetical protein